MSKFTSRRMIRTAAMLALPLAALTACDDDAYGRDKAPAVSRIAAPSEVQGSRAASSGGAGTAATPVNIEVFAPENGHVVGDAGIGWLVDMEIEFQGRNLRQTGATAFQLTGPGGHANIPPFPRPGTLGRDESLPGLVVFCSTSTLGTGANLAGLFNITGLTNRTSSETELWATWIVAGPACGTSGSTTMWIGLVADLNHNGVFDDAPDAVPDANGDGAVNGADLQYIGLASNLVTINFQLHA